MVKIIKAVWRTVKKFLDVWSDRRLAVYSAQAAYYMFVSLLPFCALMFVIIKAFPKGNASLTSKAMDLLPGLLGNVLAEAYHEAGYSSAAAVIPITAILTLWTASKGMHALSEGLKSAYGSDGSADKNGDHKTYGRIDRALHALGKEGAGEGADTHKSCMTQTQFS